MFYFFLPSILTYNVILVLAAVIPAVFLMIRVYRLDRLEKESPALLWRMVRSGIFAALIALVAERVFGKLLSLTVSETGGLYNVMLYFVVVAFSEEGAKYFLLKRHSWNNPEFNCRYDGVVYALFVSLGFALWENISYVMAYGLKTAFIRALTAIPGHACFGVFMGVFYGLAKQRERSGDPAAAKNCRILSVLLPALLHGAYDYIATSSSGDGYFIGFIVVMFAVSYYLVGKTSKNDRYI